MALSWAAFSLASLFPEEIAAVIENVQQGIETMLGFVDTVLGIIESVVQFVQDILDPIGALLDALIDAILDLINDLVNSNVFFLYQSLPAEFGAFEFRNASNSVLALEGQGRSAAATVQQMIESLYDPGDYNKPEFSGSATIGGIMLMVGAPSFTEFITTIDAFNKLLDIEEWKDWSAKQGRRFTNVPRPGSVTQVTPIGAGATIATFEDNIQEDSNVPNDAMVRMLSGKARGALFRIESVATIPGTGTGGTQFSVVPTPFGASQNERTFNEILNNISTDFNPFDGETDSQAGLSDNNAGKIQGDELNNNIFNSIAVGDRYGVEVGGFDSIAPDWIKAGPIANFFRAFDPLFTKLEQLTDILAKIKKPIDAILEAIQAIRKTLNNIRELVNTFADDLLRFLEAAAATGVHILVIPPTGGGVNTFAEQVRSAENLPPFGRNTYTAAVTMLAGTASLDPLLGLFGVS